MAPKKGKKKKSGKKRKSAKGPAIIDGISTEEMSKEQLEQHIHRLREGSFKFKIVHSLNLCLRSSSTNFFRNINIQ